MKYSSYFEEFVDLFHTSQSRVCLKAIILSALPRIQGNYAMKLSEDTVPGCFIPYHLHVLCFEALRVLIFRSFVNHLPNSFPHYAMSDPTIKKINKHFVTQFLFAIYFYTTKQHTSFPLDQTIEPFSISFLSPVACHPTFYLVLIICFHLHHIASFHYTYVSLM